MTRALLAALFAAFLGCNSAGLECPAGASEQRSESSAAQEHWCARPDGTKHGPYELSTRTHLLRGRYVHGAQHGSWLHRDVRSGFVASYVLDHGTGLVIEWYPGLRKKSEQELRGGVADGARTDYAADGRIRSVSSFRDGVPAGTWYEWGADGKETSVTQGER